MKCFFQYSSSDESEELGLWLTLAVTVDGKEETKDVDWLCGKDGY